MDGDTQARYVAVYRAKQQIEAVMAHEQAADIKARSKAGGKYGRKR